MLNGNKIRDWAYLLLRGQETIAERKRVKGTLRRAGEREGVKGTLRRAGSIRVSAN